MLPCSLVEPLKNQLERARIFHEQDIANGVGSVYLPYALKRKYPNAGRELGWQYMFPASKPAIDPRRGVLRRHHIGEKALQRAIKASVRISPNLPPVTLCVTPSPPLRHPPYRKRLRHQDSTGAVGAQGYPHHRNLHPRFKSRRQRSTPPPLDRCFPRPFRPAVPLVVNTPLLISYGP